jgi:hypothetical protein
VENSQAGTTAEGCGGPEGNERLRLSPAGKRDEHYRGNRHED